MLHQFRTLRHIVKRTFGVWDSVICNKPLDKFVEVTFTCESSSGLGGGHPKSKIPPLFTKERGLGPAINDGVSAAKIL